MRHFSYLVGGLDVTWAAEDEQTQLNKFGAQGWQLVAVIARSGPGNTACVYYYFRREIQGEQFDSPSEEIVNLHRGDKPKGALAP